MTQEALLKKQPVKFDSATPNPSVPDVQDVSPEEVSQKASSVHLVDVRGPDEYTGELGHVAGSKLIVLDTLPENLHDLPADEPIVFICRSGARSGRAAAYAQEQGFRHVFNMKGGMIQWNALGLPVEN